jgi:hypothetical protein
MTVVQDRAKLAKVKTALAEKYVHLAKVVKSQPRRAKWLRLAARFRRQAADLERQVQG